MSTPNSGPNSGPEPPPLPEEQLPQAAEEVMDACRQRGHASPADLEQVTALLHQACTALETMRTTLAATERARQALHEGINRIFSESAFQRAEGVLEAIGRVRVRAAEHGLPQDTVSVLVNGQEAGVQALRASIAEECDQAADLFERAAQHLHEAAGRAFHHQQRWRVNVVVPLADAAARLGPLYDALTATWPQAAYVHAMGPRLGLALAGLFHAAAEHARRRTAPPNQALMHLARTYLKENPS